MISLQNISKRYELKHQNAERYVALRDVISNVFKPTKKIRTTEEFWALKDVSFEVKRGDRVGLIGRNGAGKSTLLKVISRITEPTSGSVKIKGRIASLLEVGTGFHPELTGRENIYLNGAILGMSHAEIQKKFDEIVDFAEIEKFLDTPVKRYSSGMYVRLAFAVAAHLEPEILLIDEVLAVGDTLFQKKCLGKMESISQQEGKTILFVSHNMSMVNKLCNVGVLLNEGKLVYQGKVLEAIKRYTETVSTESNNQLQWVNQNASRDRLNEVLEVYSYAIVNATGQLSSTSLLSEDEYFIEIAFNLKKSNEDIRIGFGIYTEDQTLIINTSSADFEKMDFSKIKPGQYKIKIKIPIDCLYQGVYYIELLCLVENSGWVHAANNQSRKMFDVVFSGEHLKIPLNRFGGYHAPVVPNLQWSLDSK